MPQVTKELSDDGRPSYHVHGKMFCFHRGRRPDAIDPATGERLGDVLMFRVADLDEKELLLADGAASSSRRRTSTAIRPCSCGSPISTGRSRGAPRPRRGRVAHTRAEARREGVARGERARPTDRREARTDRRPERRPAGREVEHRRGDAGGVRLGLAESRRRCLPGATPPRYQPGIGLRPGYSDHAAAATRPALYAGWYESIAAESRAGLNVAAEFGHHDAAILADCARRLDGLPALFVGVRCPIDVILERRALTGKPVDPEPVQLWQERVHAPGSTTSRSTPRCSAPGECAAAIRRRLDDRAPPTASSSSRGSRPDEVRPPDGAPGVVERGDREDLRPGGPGESASRTRPVATGRPPGVRSASCLLAAPTCSPRRRRSS